MYNILYLHVCLMKGPSHIRFNQTTSYISSPYFVQLLNSVRLLKLLLYIGTTFLYGFCFTILINFNDFFYDDLRLHKPNPYYKIMIKLKILKHFVSLNNDIYKNIDTYIYILYSKYIYFVYTKIWFT